MAEGMLFETAREHSEEMIYQAYPRKVGRQDALKAIRRALKIKTYSQLLRATKEYAEAVAKWPAKDRQYIPHPSTWFNQGRYDDERSEWIRGQDDPESENFDPTRCLR